jgi:uncharacterized membrane protein
MFVNLFRNRQFLALLAGLLFLVAQLFYVELPFSEEQTLMVVGLIATYIVGEGFEGKRIITNVWQLVRSRKFLAVAAGLIVIVGQAFNPDFPIDAGKLTELFVLLAGIILGSGAERVTSPQG